MNAPIRYVFSAMQEPLHYALMLAVLGCGILARRDKSRAAWAGLCALCAVATLVRPYEAVLWLFPLALCGRTAAASLSAWRAGRFPWAARSC